VRTIEAHKRIHRGKVRYLVIEPPTKDAPRKAKWFHTKEKADAHAKIVNRARNESIAELFLLDRQSQSLLVEALRKAGSAASVLEAVNSFKAVVQPKPLSEVADAMIADREGAKRSKEYIDGLRWVFNNFARDRTSKPINEITTDDVRKWLDKVSKSVDARRGYIGRLRSLFSFAIAHGWTRDNPAKPISMPERGQGEPVIFAPEQVGKIMEAAKKDPEMLTYFALLFFAGLRPSEARRLKLDHIKPDLIRVPIEVARKKKEVRNIPMNDALRAFLSFGAPLPVERRWVNWRKRFRKITRGENMAKWKADAPRHSFVTYSNELHGWQETVSQAGHSLAMMIEHYRALTTKDEARKFWAMRPDNVLK
jgi:integrase